MDTDNIGDVDLPVYAHRAVDDWFSVVFCRSGLRRIPGDFRVCPTGFDSATFRAGTLRNECTWFGYERNDVFATPEAALKAESDQNDEKENGLCIDKTNMYTV